MGHDQHMSSDDVHYQRPGTLIRLALNPLMRAATRLGLSPKGAQTLETRGRRSGLPRQTPVNPMELDGTVYLVSPRGETEWVRNVRADGGRLTLLLGKRRQEWVATEITDPEEKVAPLRAYLQRWKAEVGTFFGEVGPDSSDDELRAIAPRHPVFSLQDSRER